MFVAHLPAGYILTTYLEKESPVKRYLWLGILASVLPDFDLVYFYLFDKGSHLHHSYWTHLPFFWLIIADISAVLIMVFKKKKLWGVWTIFFLNIFLHLFLDTIVGKIEWLYPFSDFSFSFFEVPNMYSWWPLNFIFHWTFWFEIGVILLASYYFFNELLSRKNRTDNLLNR